MKIGRNKPPFDIDDAKYDFHDFTGITEKDLLDWWLDESISEKRSPKKRKSQWPINNSIIDELPENPDIHLIFEEVVKRLSGEQNQAMFDVLHEPVDYFKHQVNPDFVLNEKNMPRRPFYCLFVAELQINTIDSEHKGRLFQYMDSILEANPCRESIVSFVTNLRNIVFAKSKRSGRFIDHFEFEEIAFWPSENSSYNGLNVIKHMINNPEKSVGYKSDQVHFRIHQEMFYIHKY